MEAGRAARRPGRTAASPHDGGLRASILRRIVPPGRKDFKSNSEPSLCTVHSFETYRDGPGRLAVSARAGRAGRRDRARAVQRGDLPGLHPRLPVLPGRDDHPAGAGAVHHHDRRDGGPGRGGQRLRRGRAAVAVERGPQRDQRDRGRPGGLLRGHQRRIVAAVDPGGCLQRDAGRRAQPERPPVRADVRAGRRLGAAAQGDQQDGHGRGPDPDRHHGLRQRLAAGEAVLHVRAAHRDRRGRAGHRAAGALRADRAYGKAIGFRYHDGRPGQIEGLLSRGDRRVGAVILAAWRDGARFDGWSEYFSYERWQRCAESALATEPVDLAWYTTRERDYSEVLPWEHLDAGLDRDWLWQDWQNSIAPEGAAEVEDCRWTPCYECGVCPAMDTEIQVGPTGARLDGRRLLPVVVGR